MAESSTTSSVRRFPNWTMDRPCPSMEWTALTTTKLSTDRSDLQDADLVVICVEVVPPAKKQPPSTSSSTEQASSSSTTAKLTGFAATLDQGLHGALSELLGEEETQKALASPGGVSTILRVVQPTKRYVLLSLGAPSPGKDSAAADDEKLPAVPKNPHGMAVGKGLASLCRSTDKKVQVLRVLFPGESTACCLAQSRFLRDLATSFYVEMYTDNRYRNNDKVVVKDHVQIVDLVASEGAGAVADPHALEHGQKLARGVYLTRDIVNAPHCVLNSVSLAETAQRIAAESLQSCLTCRILDTAECEARGMGSYLAVARGSETPPQFIHLTYRPPASVSAGGGPLKKVGLVGKGVCFDTGGYNIKTDMMDLMKFDCGGAAAVLGAARSIGLLQPPGVEAHFIVPACENMISAKAFVPSDVVQASNGATIEVKNTDAEGRLTLADALVYADVEVGCDVILELSTLTGAMLVALGWDVAGVFTDHDPLAAELADVSKFTNEKLWRMPIVPEYKEFLKSSIADVNHLGNRTGGSIQAMLFLQHFVNPDKPFAHIDMPGACWNNKLGVATGFGARLVTEWITRQGRNDE